MKTLLARMIAQDYTPNFSLSLMQKDLALERQDLSAIVEALRN